MIALGLRWSGNMTETYWKDPLWLKLEAMELDDPKAPVPLSARLVAETGLDLQVIQTAISEYKKFLYLAVTYQIPPVMPVQAERVWITHITYTRHYWDYMCGEVLGFDLHYRSPAELAEADGRPDYRGQMEAAYLETFGYRPPPGLDETIPELRSNFLLGLGYAVGFLAIVAPLMFATKGLAALLGFSAGVAGQMAAAMVGGWSCSRYRRSYQSGLPSTDENVWEALLAMSLPSLGSAVEPFGTILKKNTGWSDNKCEAAIYEYRRFLMVRFVARHPITPSADIDKVWHVHLIHSEHYWNELCGRILGKPFHHNPATGTAGEWARFRDQYLRTLATYETLFRAMPPIGTWPRDPSIHQGRALWSAIAAATAVACGQVLWPVVPLWVAALTAVTVMVPAAFAGYKWPVNDALITRKDFGKRRSGQWEVSAGGCGGCGGCGG